MIFVIMGFGVLMLVIGLILFYKQRIEGGIPIALFGGIVAILSFITMFSFVIACVESTVIDDKIAMYEKENKNIQQDITLICEQYQTHEKKTFDMSEVSTPTTLIRMFSDLKSDKMTQQQIEIYYQNNNTIKHLKETKIDYNVDKWWLYFGGK